jgi:hypothetical protein
MDSDYTAGFKAGLRYQREHTLDFIRVHDEQGVLITSEDISDEIKNQYRQDMESQLADRSTTWGQKR